MGTQKKSISPTARTLQYLRENGWFAEVVERWNPFAKVRHDLFGWIDVVAVIGQVARQRIMRELEARVRSDGAQQALSWLNAHERRPMRGVLGIQTCPGSAVSARMKKLRTLRPDAAAALRAWIDADNRLELWSWANVLSGEKRRDGKLSRKRVWALTRRRITATDLTAEHASDTPYTRCVWNI